MEAIESLDTLAEVAITLAGFSGLAAAIRGRPFEVWVPRERFTFWMLFVFSLGALLFALIPSALHHFRLSDDTVWRLASLLMLLFIGGAGYGTLIADQRLNRAGHARKLPIFFFVGWAPVVAGAVLLSLNVTGLLVGVGPGPYYVSVVGMIGLGAMNFVGFLIFPHQE